MIEQNYDCKQQILFITNSGRLEEESMRNLFSKIKKLSSITKTLFIIEDARKANVKFMISNTKSLNNSLEKVAKEFDIIHHALIIEDYKNIAIAMLITEGDTLNNYNMKFFTNEYLAKEWIVMIQNNF
jgi:hypothetical protein